MDTAEIARLLLRSGAVLLRPDEPFTFASGIRSPIYCDNRLLLGEVAARRTITAALAAQAQRLPCDVLAGVVSAGVPWAAWVAEALGLPLAYVRGVAKEHGRGNQIEGRVEAGQRVLVVEDLISTGGSSLAAVLALREHGLQADAVLCIFSYGMARAQAQFAAAAAALYPLTTLGALLDVAAAEGWLPATQRDLVASWADDPAAWGHSATN